jgi:SAM-dependent methyltransferase
MGVRGIAWRLCYELLASRVPKAEWAFMNYGYATPEAAPTLAAADEPDRLCIQLYHHVATQVPIAGADVLEVGSGRGGGASYVSRYLGPRSVTGVDFSRQAVALSTRDRRGPALRFVHGDAQALPFEDRSFDVVVNVESSHCYPSMSAFLTEVHRVLRPGGHLVWADLRDADDVERLRRHMAESPLTLVQERDITDHVLEALRVDNGRKLELIRTWIPRPVHGLFRQFAGVEGTRNYEGFRTRRVRYLSALLSRPAAP